MIELRKLGLEAAHHVVINVYYEGQLVGEYYADILVEQTVILEIKAADALAPGHEAQLLNYLKGTAFEIGLLLNFGPRAQVRRKVFDTARKAAGA